MESCGVHETSSTVMAPLVAIIIVLIIIGVNAIIVAT